MGPGHLGIMVATAAMPAIWYAQVPRPLWSALIKSFHVRVQVVGVLKMRTFLSGMPECKLGLNDKVLFESQGRSAKQKVWQASEPICVAAVEGAGQDCAALQGPRWHMCENLSV